MSGPVRAGPDDTGAPAPGAPGGPGGPVVVRPARPGDVDILVALVRELAAYEREPESARLEPAQLHAALFTSAPSVFAHVAEIDREVVGMAIWFVTFSTWTGRHGLHLEDLYVRPGARGRGAGRALVARLARTALDAGWTRVEWSVLDWNEPALRFYRSIGSRPMDGWTVHRLDGSTLATLAASDDPGR